MSDERTVNAGLLIKMLASSPSAADVYVTQTAIGIERMAVNGVAHVELPDGSHACVLLCTKIEPWKKDP